MNFMLASIWVPEFLKMPIKSTNVNQPTNQLTFIEPFNQPTPQLTFIKALLYARLFGEYNTSIAIFWRSLHWNISLLRLSFLSFPQRKLNFFIGSSPYWACGKMLDPFAHTWLMTNFIGHMSHFNGGWSHCQRPVLLPECCLVSFYISGSILPFVLRRK